MRGWAELKLGAQNSIQVSHMGGRDTALELSLLPLRVGEQILAKSWGQRQSQDSNLGTLIWDAAISLDVITTVPNVHPTT